MESSEIVVEVEEVVAQTDGNSYFFVTAGISATKATIDYVVLAIVDCIWNPESFVVAMGLVVGSNLVELVAMVEDSTTGSYLFTRVGCSKQKFFDFSKEKMD